MVGEKRKVQCSGTQVHKRKEESRVLNAELITADLSSKIRRESTTTLSKCGGYFLPGQDKF